jgi:hypothetical protein
MSRMSVLALATALAIGSLSLADAAPRGHSGGHRGGGGASKSFSAPKSFGGSSGFSSRRHSIARGYGSHRRSGFHRGGRFYRPYIYSGYSSCYRWRRVWTPIGWQLRRVNICYPRYRYRIYPYLYGY